MTDNETQIKNLILSFLFGGLKMSNMNLRLARVKQRKSQYVLSFETGIPQSTLSLIEMGFKQPKPEEARKLAKALDEDPKNIFPEVFIQ